MKLLKPVVAAALALAAAGGGAAALASEDLEVKTRSEARSGKVLHSLFSDGNGRNPRAFFDGKRLKFLGFHNVRLTIEPEDTNSDDDDIDPALADLTDGDTTTSTPGAVGDEETETPTAASEIEPEDNPLDQHLTTSSVDGFLAGYKLNTVTLNYKGNEKIKWKQGTVASEAIPVEGGPGIEGTATTIAKYNTLYKNKNNYLTYGYWANEVKVAGVTKRMDWGASINGPLIRSGPMNQTLTGRAYYENPTGAAGLVKHGDSFTEFETGVVMVVRFRDTVSLNGCIGCVEDHNQSGIMVGGKPWIITLDDGRLHEATRSIQGHGIHVHRIFRPGEPVDIAEALKVRGEKTGDHAWLGKFSRTDKPDGYPHLVTGTYGVKFDPGSGGEAQVQGYFVAGENEEYRRE